MSYPTLSDVKDYYEIVDTTYDDQLNLIILWTADLIDTYLGRKLTFGTYEQTYYKAGTEMVQLDNYPVDVINTITVNGEEKDLANYYLSKNLGAVYGDFITEDEYVVNYDGGYTALPKIIEDVFYAICDDRLKDYKDRIGVSIDADIKDVTLFDFAKVSLDTSASGQLSYQGVQSGEVPYPLSDYLGLLNLYRSNTAVMSVPGVQ